MVKVYDSYNLPANGLSLPQGPCPPPVGVIKSFNTSLLEHNLETVLQGWGWASECPLENSEKGIYLQ